MQHGGVVHACVCVCVCVCACMHVYVLCACVHACVHVCVCMCVCMCVLCVVCVCVCVCTHMYTNTHTHVHTQIKERIIIHLLLVLAILQNENPKCTDDNTWKVQVTKLLINLIHIFDDGILCYSIKCSRQVFIKNEISTELESDHVSTK